MPQPRQRYKSYAIRFVAVVCLYLLVTVTLTTTVDPWRVLRMPWALSSLEEYRDFSDAHRTGKAGLALDPKGWDIAYIGSSRLEMGLPTEYEGFGDKRVVNLAMAGGLIEENTAMAQFAIKKNPNLKTILFGIDSGDLTSRMDLSGQTDFHRSPLAKGQSTVERSLGYMTGVRSLTESLVVVSNRLKNTKSKYTLTGQRVGNLGDPPPFRDYIAARTAIYLSQARAFDTPEQSPLNMGKYNTLATFLEESREAGIEIIMIMTPRHALMQVHPREDAPKSAPWERERRELTTLCQKINAMKLKGPEIRFLDFCAFSPLNSQPLPQEASDPFIEWPDLEHCSGVLGMALIERSFGKMQEELPSWGVDVLQTGIEQHLKGLMEEHETYCRNHASDVAWFRSLIFPAVKD